MLLYRLRTFGKKKALDSLVDRSIEPRLNQIFVPLMSVVSDIALQNELRQTARDLNRELIEDRRMDVEADVLEIIKELFNAMEKPKVSVKDITLALRKRYGEDYERHITSKWVGGVIRRKLQIRTEKSHGVYIIPFTEKPTLERLFEKYGLVEDRKK